MPKVKCPACGTVVTHAEGYDPICPTCGFRAPAPSKAGPPAGYATPSYGPPAFSHHPDGQVHVPPENGLAIGALVCGILGFLVYVTAPVAIILGIIALNQPRTDSSGRTMAIIGIVLGGISLVLILLFFMFITAMFGAM